MTRETLLVSEDELRKIGHQVMLQMDPVEEQFGTERSILGMIHVVGYMAARMQLGSAERPGIEVAVELFTLGYDYGVATLELEKDQPDAN
jgi:hypothetical protein